MTFLELLTIKRIPFRRHASRAGEIYVNCPFCGDERYRLSLNSHRNVANCFNCGWKSKNAITFYLRQFGITVQIAGGPDEQKAKQSPAVTLPADFTLLSTIKKSDGPPLTDALSYALARGFTRRTLKRWRVGLSVTGKYGYRIIFPVIWRGKLRGYVARDWTGLQTPKYLNSVGDKFLWNMPRRANVVHLCEGIVKAVALTNATGLRAVATLGSDITPFQLTQLLKAKVKRVVVWSDPDGPGQAGAVKICSKIREAGIVVQIVFPVPEKQLDEHTPAELRTMLKDRVNTYGWAIECKLKCAM